MLITPPTHFRLGASQSWRIRLESLVVLDMMLLLQLQLRLRSLRTLTSTFLFLTQRMTSFSCGLRLEANLRAQAAECVTNTTAHSRRLVAYFIWLDLEPCCQHVEAR